MTGAELISGIVVRDKAIAERVRQTDPLVLYDLLNELVSHCHQEMESQGHEYCTFCGGTLVEWIAENEDDDFGHKSTCRLMEATRLRDKLYGE